MRTARPYWLSIACWLGLTAACASPRPTLLSAAQGSDGRIWLGGEDGFAASRLRDGGLTRMSYPLSGPRCALRAVRVVEARGEPWLITCHGEVMRVSADHERWEPLEAQPMRTDSATDTVVAAVAMPSGEIVVQRLHGLWWWKPGSEQARYERLPSPIDDLSVIGDELYGVGYLGPKAPRAVLRRVGLGAWEQAHVLPASAHITMGVFYVGERLYVPTSEGLLAQREHIGGLEPLPLDEVVGARVLAPLAPSKRDRTHIRRAFTLRGQRMALAVEGDAEGFVVIAGPEAMSFWPCGRPGDPAILSIFADDPGFSVLRADGSLYRAGETGCKQLAPAIR